MRRLTHAEYQSSISALFFPATISSTLFDLPPDAISGGFDNNAEGINISDLLIEQYQSASEAVSNAVFSDTTNRKLLIGCDLADASLAAATKDACLLKWVQRMGRMAYRRPLSTDEQNGLMALARLPSTQKDSDTYAPAKLVAQALLQSSNFIFRVELGQRTPKRDVFKLTGYEVATRLAYLFTTRGPDETLLLVAEQGGLDTIEGIQAQAQRLISTTDAPLASQVKQGVQNFYTQWFNFGKLNTVRHDQYTAWTPSNIVALREETTRLADDYIWSADRRFLDIFVAPYTFMNSTVASFYGNGAVSGGAFQKVNVDAASDRLGVLGHAALIAANTKSDETAMIFRGKFVSTALLCQVIPAPDPADAMATGVDRLSTPKCAACHKFMDKIGTGFARFNAVGLPIDNAASVGNGGTIESLNQKAFTGVTELARIIASEPTVNRCLVSKLLTFGEGKQMGTDVPEVAQLLSAYESTHQNLLELYMAYVASDRFRYRVVPQ